MNVGELRKTLEGVPDETEVFKTPTPYDPGADVEVDSADICYHAKFGRKDRTRAAFFLIS